MEGAGDRWRKTTQSCLRNGGTLASADTGGAGTHYGHTVAFAAKKPTLKDLLLSLGFAEHAKLLLQVGKDVDVNLEHAGALDELVDLAHGRVAGQGAEVREEVRGLGVEEDLELFVLQRLVPEGAQVDTENLGSLDDLAQAPHEGAVDPDEGLLADHISLVQDAADLVIVALERGDGRFELIGDVQLVGVEQEQDAVAALGEPLADLGEVVAAGDALLLA